MLQNFNRTIAERWGGIALSPQFAIFLQPLLGTTSQEQMKPPPNLACGLFRWYVVHYNHFDQLDTPQPCVTPQGGLEGAKTHAFDKNPPK